MEIYAGSSPSDSQRLSRAFSTFRFHHITSLTSPVYVIMGDLCLRSQDILFHLLCASPRASLEILYLGF